MFHIIPAMSGNYSRALDSLFKTFGDIRKNPKKICGLLRPYF